LIGAFFDPSRSRSEPAVSHQRAATTALFKDGDAAGSHKPLVDTAMWYIQIKLQS
jgi:hypothetical protein